MSPNDDTIRRRAATSHFIHARLLSRCRVAVAALRYAHNAAISGVDILHLLAIVWDERPRHSASAHAAGALQSIALAPDSTASFFCISDAIYLTIRFEWPTKTRNAQENQKLALASERFLQASWCSRASPDSLQISAPYAYLPIYFLT